MTKKIINGCKKFPKSLFLGFIDAILPNIKESIKEIPSEFLNDKGKVNIDYLRLGSATVFFVMNILCILDVITYNDLINVLKQWNLLLL
jgi:hypothetical protein